MKVEVPPLSKRREDIPLPVRHLVLEIARESRHAQNFVIEIGGRKYVRMSSALVTALVRRDYAGNTRDLEGALRIAMEDSTGNRIELSPRLAQAAKKNEELTEAAMLNALQKAGGNVSKAARLLGVDIGVLRYQLKKLGLRR